ncbi:MAG TPA: APC family permease [Gaiellaceae bacterium]|nr:APC family permease [Gaiellaceae bacterium]
MDVPAEGLTAGQAIRKAATQPVFISWLALAFMTTASVASLRSSPTMAVYGLACVFLYIVPAIVFLMPQALVAAELASGWDGGVYRWVSEGLSGPWGMLAVWCQFAMTIFYYPTLLGFVASTLAYVFNPDLATNGVYTGIVIVVVFWLGVFLSARGGTGGIAKLASSGLLIGTLIPGALLVVLGVIYLLQGNSSAAPMNASHLLPEWAGIASLVLIVNNFLSYSGMEMNAVHVSSLRNPRKEFPKAMFFAVGLVLLIFILPTLAISWVVPAQELSLTAGVMQAFSAFFAHFNLTFLVPVVAIALVCASAGGMLTWLAGPSKGLLLIAQKEGYMPPFFQRENANGIPVNILVVQGGITTVIALLYALIPSVSSAYWILSVMTTQVYLIVYLLMFVAARRLRQTQPDVERGYRAPWLSFLCVLGFLASAAAIVIGFVPPSQFGNSNAGVYVLIILAGTVLIGILPAWLFLKLRKPSWKLSDGGGADEPPPPATEPPPPEPEAAAASPAEGHSHRRLYVIIGAVLVALVVVGLITYKVGSNNQEAQQKAQQLVQKFEQAGLPVPQNIDQVTRSLGTDGGAVCDNPANALGKAILNDELTNGADFVGRRPVRVPRRILLGEALILQTYCPEKLQAYQNKINDLKTASTVKP